MNELSAHQAGMKQCSKCGYMFPGANFSRDSSRRDGLRVQCKGCDRSYTKLYRARHPTRSAERWAEIKADPAAHQAEIARIANSRARIKADPERSEESRRVTSLRGNAWRAQNPEKVKATAKKKSGRRIKTLHDSYMRTVLSQTSGIPYAQVPEDLIEAKRIHLTLIRELKARKK